MIWYITFVNYDDFVRLTGTHYKDYVSERLTGTRSGDLCPLLLQFSHVRKQKIPEISC